MPVLDALISGVGGLVNALGGSALSQHYNEKNMRLQEDAQKRLMDYQWSNFGSPQAQVDAMAAAGLNPANLLGEGKSSFASPQGGMPSSAPISVDGVVDVNGISNYIKSVADAKKAGMDTKLSEQEIHNKEVERQRNEFQLSLEKEFGRHDWTSKIANEYMKLILASDQSDINEQEKALNEFKITISDLEKQIKGDEREMVSLKLKNLPILLQLENRVKESEAESNEASAHLAYANALVSREIQRQETVKAEVLESGKKDQIKALIDGYRKDRMISHKDYQEALRLYNDILLRNDRRQDSNFVNKVDALFNWLGDILGAPLKNLK